MEATISMRNRLKMWLKYAVLVFRRFSTRYFGIYHFFLRYCGIGYPPMSPSLTINELWSIPFKYLLPFPPQIFWFGGGGLWKSFPRGLTVTAPFMHLEYYFLRGLRKICYFCGGRQGYCVSTFDLFFFSFRTHQTLRSCFPFLKILPQRS